jgi:predicted RND superfamily exporter protein
LGRTSTILLAMTIIACFRSLRWTLAPILVVQLALLLTQAALSVGGMRLSMVSSMLTAIVTVIGVATVVTTFERMRP